MVVQGRQQRQQQEVDANYEAFQKKETDLLGRHAGKFALMKDREVIEFFDTDRDAWAAGKLRYGDDVFSVQEVGAHPLKLGWTGYALFHRSR